MRRESEDLVDQLLVMRWQDGHGEAMDLLVQRWQHRLWQHARRLTGDDEAASEVVQESWLGMLRSVTRLEDPQRFPYWAYRIVTNKARDWIRARQRRRAAAAAVADQITVPDGNRNPELQVENADSLTALLADLSVEHRAVLLLRFVEELTVPEIAATLGLPEGTVKSRLHYAKEIIRQRLT